MNKTTHTFSVEFLESSEEGPFTVAVAQTFATLNAARKFVNKINADRHDVVHIVHRVSNEFGTSRLENFTMEHDSDGWYFV